MDFNVLERHRGGPDRKLNVTLIILCTSFQAVAYAALSLFLPIIREDLSLSFIAELLRNKEMKRLKSHPIFTNNITELI